MKTFRILLGLLAIPVLILGLLAATDPMFDYNHSDWSLALTCIGLPILALNYLAWDAPHVIKAIFNIKEDS